MKKKLFLLKMSVESCEFLKTYHLSRRSAGLSFRNLLQESSDFLLLVEAFPQLKKIDDCASNFLDFLHVNVELGEPMLELFLQDNTGDLEGANGDLWGEVEVKIPGNFPKNLPDAVGKVN